MRRQLFDTLEQANMIFFYITFCKIGFMWCVTCEWGNHKSNISTILHWIYWASFAEFLRCCLCCGGMKKRFWNAHKRIQCICFSLRISWLNNDKCKKPQGQTKEKKNSRRYYSKSIKSDFFFCLDQQIDRSQFQLHVNWKCQPNYAFGLISEKLTLIQKKTHKIIDKNMRQNANYKNTNETYSTDAPKLIAL